MNKNLFNYDDETTDIVEAEVTNVDVGERRISLSAKSIKDRQRKDSYDAQYMGEEEGARVTFGDLIREQMRGDKN
jgi:ribosomal protein S1